MGICLASAAPLLAQARGVKPAPPQPPATATQKPAVPTFTASTHLVQIPVIVGGRDGTVGGLTAADFTVTDNGKTQAIKFFSSTTAPAAAATAPVSAPAPASGPSSFTNVATPDQARQPHPVVVILLDALNTNLAAVMNQGEPVFQQVGAFQYTKNQLTSFVRILPPEDKVALYGLSDRLALLSDFTNDRTQLLTALQAFKPVVNPGAVENTAEANTDVPGDFNNKLDNANAGYAALKAENSGTITMQALRAIANHLALLPGRVSLVWLTANPGVAGATVAAALGTSKIAVYPVDARGLMTRAGLEAKSGLNGFPVGNMEAYLNTPVPGQDALLDIAKQTGGRAFLNTNDIAGAIGTAAADSETSYTLGFYVDAKVLDNSFHTIRVKVQGHGLDPRYPSGYWALADNAPQRALNAISQAIANPDDATGIGLHATAQLLPNTRPPLYRVAGTVDMHAFALAEQDNLHAGTLVIALAQQNAAGVVLWRDSRMIPMHLQDSLYQALLAQGLPFEVDVKGQAGARTLRLIVEDPASGSTGSLILPLDQLSHSQGVAPFAP